MYQPEATTVVFLLSDKRSGSTFLEREICTHPLIQHVSYTPHTYNETHFWTKAAQVQGSPEALYGGHQRPRSYGSSRAARASLIRGIKGNLPDFVVPNTDESLVFKGWEALSERFAQPVFFEKTPHHLHHWAALELILQWKERTSRNVRFLGLVRNPMAVLYSAQNLFYSKPTLRQYSWFEANRNLLLLQTLIGDDSLLLLRYEDVIADPGTQFSRIFDFIGVPRDERIPRSAHNKSLNLWRDDPRFDLHLDKAVIRLAGRLGYDPEELGNPPKPRPSIASRWYTASTAKYNRGRSLAYNAYKRLFR